MRRRFSRRRRRTFWTGNATAISTANVAVDFTQFSVMMNSDELLDRAPHGCTVLRILMFMQSYVAVSAENAQRTWDADYFIFGAASGQDDAGNETWVGGTNVLKPFVREDLANVDIASARDYMWTYREQTSISTSAAAGLQAATNTYQPPTATGNVPYVFTTLKSPNGLYPALDLKVKRRLQLGENVIFGVHYPAGIPATQSHTIRLAYRILCGIN